LRWELIAGTGALDFVRHRHISIKTEHSRAVLRIQSQIMSSIRTFFDKQRFTEVKPAIIGPATDPGVRGAGAASIEFYGAKYLLTTSMILYKQMLISSLDKVYVFSPCIRLEKQRTDRHLAEFLQVDVEAARCSAEEAMGIAEDLLVSVAGDVLKRCNHELGMLGRKISLPRTPFRRLTFEQAVDMAAALGFDPDYTSELPFKAEKEVSMSFKEPFFITGYPAGSRGFYYRQDPERPGRLLDFDMVFPQGFGEAISGGEREHEYPAVVSKFRERRMDPGAYRWYLDMLKEGIPPSAGFGIGLERLTRYICGLESIWEATPFPKVPGVHSP
jgi:asparaginyl-tRNA synthetase